MEDAKLQALHDTLSQIRGKKGLGTNTQYSWQTGETTRQQRHPSAACLPDNALYANFLPEGVYDPNSKRIDDGDGRIVKRDFSDAVMNDSSDDKKSDRNDKLEKRRHKELRKAEKKIAKKAEKLTAKKEARMLEKKLQKKLEKKLMKKRSSCNIETNELDEVETTMKKGTEKGFPIDNPSLKSEVLPKIDDAIDSVVTKKRTTTQLKKGKTKRATTETVLGRLSESSESSKKTGKVRKRMLEVDEEDKLRQKQKR
jgi:hypothetical protein